MKAISLSTELNKQFEVEIPLRELFVKQNVVELEKWIETAKKTQYATIKKAGEKEYYALSPAQKECIYSIN